MLEFFNTALLVCTDLLSSSLQVLHGVLLVLSGQDPLESDDSCTEARTRVHRAFPGVWQGRQA